MPDRNVVQAKISDRLRSLAAMTVENGCTEAEAARAHEAAERMRARYGIADEELGAANSFDHGEPQAFTTWESSRPKRRAFRSFIGWAFYCIGWITALAAAAAFTIDPAPDGPINKMLGFDVRDFIFLGLAMVFVGEALDGDETRPATNNARSDRKSGEQDPSERQREPADEPESA